MLHLIPTQKLCRAVIRIPPPCRDALWSLTSPPAAADARLPARCHTKTANDAHHPRHPHPHPQQQQQQQQGKEADTSTDYWIPPNSPLLWQPPHLCPWEEGKKGVILRKVIRTEPLFCRWLEKTHTHTHQTLFFKIARFKDNYYCLNLDERLIRYWPTLTKIFGKQCTIICFLPNQM